MPSDDRFKKAQQAGADWFDTARARAEEFLRELGKASGTTQERAQGALDELVEGGRKGTEQLISSIRNEIATQLGLLGLATKADLADLERRLTGRAAGAGGPAPVPRPKKASVAKKTPGAAKATGSAKKTSPATGPAPATKPAENTTD
jgi:hypothetical protein